MRRRPRIQQERRPVLDGTSAIAAALPVLAIVATTRPATAQDSDRTLSPPPKVTIQRIPPSGTSAARPSLTANIGAAQPAPSLT